MSEALVSLSLPNMGTREADPTKILQFRWLSTPLSDWVKHDLTPFSL